MVTSLSLPTTGQHTQMQMNKKANVCTNSTYAHSVHIVSILTHTDMQVFLA